MSGFAHVGALVAPATTVKDKTIVSYDCLDRVKEKINTYGASSDKKIEVLNEIRKELTQIIDVFNRNIALCRDELGSKATVLFKVAPGTTMTVQSGEEPDAVKEVGAKEIEQILNATIEDNILNIQQLGSPQERLKGKIEKMIQRAATQGLAKDQFPTLLQPEIVEKYKIQTLGQYQPAEASISTSTSTSTSTTSSTSSAAPISTSTEETTLSLSGDLMASTIYATHTVTSTTAATTTATTQVVASGTPNTPNTPDASVPSSPPASTPAETTQVVASGTPNTPDASTPTETTPLPTYSMIDPELLFARPPVVLEDGTLERKYVDLKGQHVERTQAVTSTQSSPPSHWQAKIHHSLGLTSTLAICHHPSWGAKPVPFTTTDGGSTWEGQIPWGVEFKYVIMEPGKDLNWELGNNRQITDATEADLVANRDAKFRP